MPNYKIYIENRYETWKIFKDVTFDDVIVGGNLTVNGTTTTVNSNTVNIGDNIITLNSDETGTPSQDAGITIERGTSANKSLVWTESTDKWSVGSETFVAGTFEGNLTGNITATSGTNSLNAITVSGTSSLAAVTVSGNLTDKDGVTGGVIPSGGIIMWSGQTSAIPTGWYLCDGNNGTPNLTNRFVMGAGTSNETTTGGTNSLALAETNIPSHTHSFSTTTGSNGSHTHTGTTNTTGAHTHTLNAGGTAYPQSSPNQGNQLGVANASATTSSAGAHSHTLNVDSAGSHTHSVSGTTGSTGSTTAFDNRPAYMALAYIMKA